MFSNKYSRPLSNSHRRVRSSVVLVLESNRLQIDRSRVRLTPGPFFYPPFYFILICELYGIRGTTDSGRIVLFRPVQSVSGADGSAEP